MDRCRPGGDGWLASPGRRPSGPAVGADRPRRVLRVHPGTARGAVEARWRSRDPLATERVLRVASTGWPGRSAAVLRPGAASEVARLYEGVPRRGRALWRQADRLARGAAGWRSSYPASAGHGPLHRPRLAVPPRGLGHVSASDLRRSDRYFVGRPGRGGETRNRARRLHGTSAALSARLRESGGDPGPGDLYGPSAPPEPGHVPLRRGHPGVSYPM